MNEQSCRLDSAFLSVTLDPITLSIDPLVQVAQPSTLIDLSLPKPA